jgi:protein-S-isoprenylcysteine O-methyltransferase Ste14
MRNLWTDASRTYVATLTVTCVLLISVYTLIGPPTSSSQTRTLAPELLWSTGVAIAVVIIGVSAFLWQKAQHKQRRQLPTMSKSTPAE